jgi:thiol-disulfide isomerase/thioredoxin
VEPQGDYAQRRQAIRTDSQGRGILTGLPTGAVRVFAKYGSLILQSDIVINDAINAAEETELRLHEPNPAPAAKAKSIPDPPPVGAAAPEWSISKWTDGGTRTLQSYRGKVVVLTFWSIRFKECVNAFPVVGELETKYADHDDVVFLGIHSAGTEMSEVKKLQHLENWTLLTGLDKGIDLADGATGRAYGVRGWPTTVIIDRDGKIVYNSNLEKRSAATIRQETARVVKILGLPPEKAEASTDENIDRSNKINAFRLSEHIDIAIKDTSQ